ncbi:MAG: PD40 domain-containing protein [Anaerolineales bacterium]|nr:PD40 domain-containing protein [Anaerolineales bacterium]
MDIVTIWDTREGNPVLTLDVSATSAISWSPDGRFLAMASSGDVEIRSVFLP